MNDILYRYAVSEDLPALCRIWALSFGDEEALVRQIFLDSGILPTTVVCERKAHVCGMMTAFDGLLFEGKAASYLYALCTHPEHRRQGIGEALTRESARLAYERGSDLVCLHPASAPLAAWYETLGFVPTASPVYREILPNTAGTVKLSPLSAEEYARCRKAFGAAQLPQALLKIQALFCQKWGDGLFRAKWNGKTALLCAERQGQELILREFLCNGFTTAAFAAAVTAQLGAHRSWLGSPRAGMQISSPPQLMFMSKDAGSHPHCALLPFLLD